MIRAIIIDDEQPAVDRLSELLHKHCRQSVKVLGSFNSVEDGTEAIKILKPELVFLDMHLHDKTGFDLLEKIPEKNFDLIFVTAYEQYAIKAFKFSAIDYLLKPVDPDELTKAIKRVDIVQSDMLARKINTLLENIGQLKQYTHPKKIVVPTLNGLEFVPLIDIIYCESKVNYTTFVLKDNKKLTVAKTLKDYEEKLSDFNFFRIHKSHLINLAYVRRYNKGKGGFAVMTDGAQLEVATRKKEEFLEKLSKMNIGIA